MAFKEYVKDIFPYLNVKVSTTKNYCDDCRKFEIALKDRGLNEEEREEKKMEYEALKAREYYASNC